MPQRDPVTRTQMFLLREGILDEKGINQLEKEVEEELADCGRSGAGSPSPAPESIMNFVYSPDLDPTSSAFETQAGGRRTTGRRQEAGRQDHGRSDHRHAAR